MIVSVVAVVVVLVFFRVA